MPPRSSPAKGIWLALIASLSLGAAGCSSDDIQFNGGIFDAVGLSDAGKTKGGDPKLAERAPLVVPPSLDRLPPPGEAPPPAQIADIKDPDEQKKLSQADLEAKQAEYCKVNYEDAIKHGDETTAANAEGPLGPCRKSVLTAIKKWNQEDEVEGQ
jgi:hypothetical protein